MLFTFVRSSGDQLKRVTEIVEKYHIMPDMDARIFTLSQMNEALGLMAHGKLNGKIILPM
ncbi:MAG TPA: zinc-binding dehydrogenase [Candidatus Parabacteroides faecavium]|nr:zinc-binding dehydrogenase [Candidatus Parabacteroides faecavium]